MISTILTGCASPEVLVQERVTFQFEPEIYAHCLDFPEPPRRGATTADRRDWEAELVGAYRDCKAKVDGGAAWAEQRRLEATVGQ